MSTSRRGKVRGSYHHGDLRAACLHAALALLEEGDHTTLSLREVARRAGVSPNAPYRHYADKEALLAALVTHGFDEMRERLAAADVLAAEGEEFVAMAQTYVRYALEHPSLFRLMLGHPCSRSHPETGAAADRTRAVLCARVEVLVPEEQRETFTIGSWSLVHGLSTLLVEGKLPADDPVRVAELVRGTVTTMLGPWAARAPEAGHGAQSA